MIDHPAQTSARETEPVVPYPDETAMSEDARALLTETTAMLGVIPNAPRTYLHRPDIARAVDGLYRSIVLSEASTLPTALKIKLGVICSSVNGCVYCTSHQCSLAQTGAGGANWGLADEELVALISGRDGGATEMERLCFEFARTASFSAPDVPLSLLEQLKAHLTAPQIVELGCVVSMWKFFNTMHDSLHIPAEAGMARYADVIGAGRADAAAAANDAPSGRIERRLRG